MKKILAWLGIFTCALSFVARADETYSHPTTRLTLHFDMRLGSNGRPLALPILGLSLDREFVGQSSFGRQWNAPQSIAVIDLRFNRFGAQGLRIGGADAMSYGDENTVWRNPWFWVGIGAGALLISCAAENFPCGGSSNMNGKGAGY